MIEKKHIIEKSAILFKTYGIRSNTMDDIARKSGISKKTLYQHITNKDELIIAVINQEYLDIKDTIEKITSDSTNSIEELIRINALIINFLKKISPATISDLRKLYQTIYNNSKIRFRDMFSNTILKSIRDGKKSDIFRNDINEELITQLHTNRIDQMQETSGLWGAASGSPKVIKEMITYYIRGLVTKQGEILLNKYIIDFDKYINE